MSAIIDSTYFFSQRRPLNRHPESKDRRKCKKSTMPVHESDSPGWCSQPARALKLDEIARVRDPLPEDVLTEKELIGGGIRKLVKATPYALCEWVGDETPKYVLEDAQTFEAMLAAAKALPGLAECFGMILLGEDSAESPICQQKCLPYLEARGIVVQRMGCFSSAISQVGKADSSAETTATSMRKPLGTCEMCMTTLAKYRCPRCEIQTCGIACISAHKNRTGCNGKRNVTKYISTRHFTDKDLRSDYNFLENVRQSVDTTKRLLKHHLPQKASAGGRRAKRQRRKNRDVDRNKRHAQTIEKPLQEKDND